MRHGQSILAVALIAFGCGGTIESEDGDQARTSTSSASSQVVWEGRDPAARAIRICGMSPDSTVRPSRFKGKNYGLHRHSDYTTSSSYTIKSDIVRALPGATATGIINPVAMQRGSSWEIFYAGWDMLPASQINKDRIFSITTNDLTGTNPRNRRLVLENDPADPSLFHINDFTIVRISSTKLRLYYSQMAFDSLATISRDDPRAWGRAVDGQPAVTIPWIATSVSYDNGATWWDSPSQGRRSSGARTNRNNRIILRGVKDRHGNTLHPSQFFIHWGAAFYYSGRYHLYVTVQDNQNCRTTSTWPSRPADAAFCDKGMFEHSSILVHATSTDGVTFDVTGKVVDQNNSVMPGIGANAGVIAGEFLFGVGGNAWLDDYHFYHLFGRASASQPSRVSFFDFDRNGRFEPWGLTDGVLYTNWDVFPTNHRDVDTRILTDASDRMLGFMTGSWNTQHPSTPYAANESYLGAIFVQKEVQFVATDGRTYSYQTAAGQDCVLLSQGPVRTSQTRWVVHQNNNLNSYGQSAKTGKLRFYDYDGRFLYESPTITLTPGDRWRLTTSKPKQQIAVFVDWRHFVDTNGDGRYSGNTDGWVSFGQAGDRPLAGRLGKAATGDSDVLGVYRRGRLYLDDSGQAGWQAGSDTSIDTGGPVNGWPFVGDFNGDGIEELGVFDPSDCQGGCRVRIDFSHDLRFGNSNDASFRFGAAGDRPVVQRRQGLRDLFAVYRPSDRYFYIDSNQDFRWSTGDQKTGPFGNSEDLPVALDVNQDGVEELGTYRPSDGRFYFDSNGQAAWQSSDTTFQFGVKNGLPLTLRSGPVTPATADPLLQLHRLYSSTYGDHFYTKSPAALQPVEHYTYERVEGCVYQNSASGRLPLRRYYNATTNDHLYQTSTSTPAGYRYEQNEGYIYSAAGGGRVPMFRYYSSATGDHFYLVASDRPTSNPTGYAYQGIVGYLRARGDCGGKDWGVPNI